MLTNLPALNDLKVTGKGISIAAVIIVVSHLQALHLSGKALKVAGYHQAGGSWCLVHS